MIRPDPRRKIICQKEGGRGQISEKLSLKDEKKYSLGDIVLFQEQKCKAIPYLPINNLYFVSKIG